VQKKILTKKKQKTKKNSDFSFKIVLVGDTCVGKSSILVRFCDDIFSDNYITTIGVDFKFKTLLLKNKTIKIQIWDTAGQERYRSMTTTYYRGANAIIICYDISNHESFDNLNKWINDVKKFSSDDTEIFIFGNKIDEENKRKVLISEKNEFENSFHFNIFEVSAKSGKNIEEAFKKICEGLIEKK
jgi:Ras-related protein Rab-1A